jgi:hypothetical protein
MNQTVASNQYKRYFCAFADSGLAPSLVRIGLQARNSGVFDSILRR